MEAENDKYIKERKANIFLYFIVIIANLTCFTCGTAYGWSSPVIPKLSNGNEHHLGIVLTDDELTWLVSLMSLGAVLGPFVGGYLADRIGRKRTLIVSTLPFILSYYLLAFINNLYVYFIARLIKGICLGLLLTVVPMYVGEVAEVHNRGTLGSFTIFFVNLGMLYSFIVGPYLSLQLFNVSCSIVGIIFVLMCTILMPESPSYLLLKENHEEARTSLKKLRCGSIENELAVIAKVVKESKEGNGNLCLILKTKYLYKALITSLGLMITQQFAAVSVINFYLQVIFENANSTIPPEISTIIIGSVQTSASLLVAIIVEKSGRRPLLLCSTIISSLCLFTLSTYFYLLTKIDVSQISWLPITTLIIYAIFYSIGIGPLAYAVMGEIFLPHVKCTSSSLSVSCCYLCSFAAAKLFPFLESLIGTWFGFLFFAIGNSLGVIFIWFYLIETKGKTLMEITDNFKGSKN